MWLFDFLEKYILQHVLFTVVTVTEEQYCNIVYYYIITVPLMVLYYLEGTL